MRAAEVGLHAGRQDAACRRGARDRSPRRAARADGRQTHLRQVAATAQAIETQRVDVVRAIGRRAEQLGQTAVKHICDKWLQQRKQ